MNNKLHNAFAFLVGAAIGSVVTWRVLKNKYAQMAQEEIDSVKEAFSKEVKITDEGKLTFADEVEDKKSYSLLPLELGYISHEEDEKEAIKNGIYVISPDDFDEMGYETVSLTYYADKILAYDSDEIVENIDEVVGEGSLNCFGEYEDDSVFVRNDVLKIDYEILLDMRNYSDVVGKDPHLPNDDE